jgi:hypothetical protein
VVESSEADGRRVAAALWGTGCTSSRLAMYG